MSTIVTDGTAPNRRSRPAPTPAQAQKAKGAHAPARARPAARAHVAEPEGPPAVPLEARLAARVAAEREQRGWSVAELAAASGVSRAMISKIERGAASPTASLLVKVAAAFGLPLSLLLARAEGEASRISRADDQQRWQDPESGYRRRAVSPPSDGLLQLTEVELPAGARVAFPAAAYTFIHQQIWVLDGTLTFHEGATVHRLGAGDCLSLGPPVEHTFENRTKRLCRYLVIVVRR